MEYSPATEQAPDNCGQPLIDPVNGHAADAAGPTTHFVDCSPYLTLMPAVRTVVSSSTDQQEQHHRHSSQQQVAFDHAPTGARLNPNFVYIDTGFSYGK
uniref:Uncharacterized protein n=1 Tax=Romanomermis culicivorax TaxID=13658 RepID=A0A915IQU4_ROMCU